jgi:hypothetical protein
VYDILLFGSAIHFFIIFLETILTVCAKMSSSNPADIGMQGSDSSGNELGTALDTKTLKARSMVPDEFRPFSTY